MHSILCLKPSLDFIPWDIKQEFRVSEIQNNILKIIFKGNYDESKRFYEAANKIVERDMSTDPVYYGAISVTISYNIGRLYEAKHEYDLAEKAYQAIVEKNPQYLDCFLRLGCMCRDRGQILDASEWFKEALRVNQSNPDIWSLIGNLHLEKEQLGPAQHQFERIIKANDQDTYALVALGNIWLHTLYQSTRDKEKEKRHEQRALQMFKQVLKIDPRNIWAANGVGCVLAHKKLLNEARDIFAQIREATADFKDVWLNIAHILVEQGQHLRAIQMYENCMKKFYKHTNIEVLIYLIRAFAKANRLQEAKQALLRARHVAPEDTLVMCNLAIVQQKLSKQVMSDDKSNLSQVQKAINDLKAAQCTFKWLGASMESSSDSATHGIDNSLREYKFDFDRESKVCSDLLAQASYHLSRAQKLDEEEKELKRRQENEIQQLKIKQMQEELQREQEIEQQKLALMEKRAEYIKKTESVAMSIQNIERSAGAKKRSKRDTGGEIVTSDEENLNNDESSNQDQHKLVKTKSKSSKSSKSKSKKRKTNTSDNESEVEDKQSDSPSEEEEEEEEEEEHKSSQDDGNKSDGQRVEKESRKKKHKKEKKSKNSRMYPKTFIFVHLYPNESSNKCLKINPDYYSSQGLIFLVFLTRILYSVNRILKEGIETFQ